MSFVLKTACFFIFFNILFGSNSKKIDQHPKQWDYVVGMHTYNFNENKYLVAKDFSWMRMGIGVALMSLSGLGLAIKLKLQENVVQPSMNNKIVIYNNAAPGVAAFDVPLAEGGRFIRTVKMALSGLLFAGIVAVPWWDQWGPRSLGALALAGLVGGGAMGVFWPETEPIANFFGKYLSESLFGAGVLLSISALGHQKKNEFEIKKKIEEGNKQEFLLKKKNYEENIKPYKRIYYPDITASDPEVFYGEDKKKYEEKEEALWNKISDNEAFRQEIVRIALALGIVIDKEDFSAIRNMAEIIWKIKYVESLKKINKDVLAYDENKILTNDERYIWQKRGSDPMKKFFDNNQDFLNTYAVKINKLGLVDYTNENSDMHMLESFGSIFPELNKHTWMGFYFPDKNKQFELGVKNLTAKNQRKETERQAAERDQQKDASITQTEQEK